MLSESTEILKESSVIEPCTVFSSEPDNSIKNISETSRCLSKYSKSFLEKYEKVLRNIKNKIYKPKITQIMVHQKIGYPMAEKILSMLTEHN